jgi:hypothetical protein
MGLDTGPEIYRKYGTQPFAVKLVCSTIGKGGQIGQGRLDGGLGGRVDLVRVKGGWKI